MAKTVTGYDRRDLTIAATSIAEGHWHRKGAALPAFSRERARCYGIATEFRELHDALINEKTAEEKE